jgi:hypothetical protein
MRLPHVAALTSLTTAALLAVAAAAGAQAPGTTSLKVSPKTVTLSGGVAKVTFTGKGWGGGHTECHRVITMVADDGAGNTTRLKGVRLPTQPRRKETFVVGFTQRVNIQLAPGAYTITATQACDQEEGGADEPNTAQATLTVQ